jgi:flavorubredoxin
MRQVDEIASNVFSVGVKHWNRRIFDNIFSLPYGTSYNSYLVKGKEKTALVDTSQPGFENELLENIRQVILPEKIDFVIMNHAEADHAGGIPRLLEAAPRSTLITSVKGKELAEAYYEVESNRIRTVKEGDSIDLSGKVLKFIDAPWLHWPETMFTYLEPDKILFPCDFFGAHFASSKLYADEVSALPIESQRYYTLIMAPYGQASAAKNAVEKVRNLNVRMIAPSHGPIHRYPDQIVEPYSRWANRQVLPRVVTAYGTMYGNTETLTKEVVKGILSEGVETSVHDLSASDSSYVISDALDAAGIVIGTPTMDGVPFPPVTLFLEMLKLTRMRDRISGIVGDFGWNGGAVMQVKRQLETINFQVIGTVEARGKPRIEDLQKARELGETIGKRVLQAAERS